MLKRLYSVKKIIESHLYLLYRYVLILQEDTNRFLQNACTHEYYSYRQTTHVNDWCYEDPTTKAKNTEKNSP